MDYLTTGEAARLCGVGINTVKRWIQKNELKCVITPGGHWRIVESEFHRFLAAHNMKLQAEAQTHKVLLIEDDEAMISMIEAAIELSASDIQFDSASDGYTGLMKVGNMQPDLLILDIMLPEINGLELIQRIRSANIIQGLRIIVITGASDRRIVKRALEKADVDAVLFKPFEIAELIVCIEKMLTHPPMGSVTAI